MSHPTHAPDSGAAPLQRPQSADAADTGAGAGHGSGSSRTAALYRAALGPVNAARYLQVFARFDAVGRPLPVWHPAAALATLNWMIFRRLWSEAAAYAVAMTALLAVCGGLWLLTAGWPVGVRAGLVGALLLLGGLAPGWLGYALVHRQLQRRVLRAATDATTMDQALRTLRWQASSWQRLQVLVVCNALLLAALWLGVSRCCSGGPPEPLRGVWQMLSGPPHAVAPADTSPPAAPKATVAAAATALAPEVVTATAATAPAPAPAPAARPSDTAVVMRPASAPGAVPADASPAAPPVAPAPVPAAAPEAAAVVAETAPAARAAPRPTVRPPAAKRHGVNVGLFAQPDNARRAFERLQQAGLPATLEVIATAQGERSRVRVGPFDQPQAAELAALRVRALGLDAVAFSMP